MRKTIAAGTVATVIALGTASLNFSYAQRTQDDFQSFRTSICQLAAGQAKNQQAFQRLLGTLESRALAREATDRRAGDLTAAAADSDSARLYAVILADYRAAPRQPKLPC